MTDNPSITIKNFKSYKDATLPLSPLTLLIGANASGKSNAIEAFRFLSWVAGGERLSTLKNRVNDSDKVVRGSVFDLALNNKNFTLSMQLNEANYKIDFIVDLDELYIVDECLSLSISNDIQKLYILRDALLNKEHLKTLNLESLIYEKFLLTNNEEHNVFITHNNSFIGLSSIKTEYSKDLAFLHILIELHDKIYHNKNFGKDIKNAINNFENNIHEIDDKFKLTRFFDFQPSNMRQESIVSKELNYNGSNVAGVLFHTLDKDNHYKNKLLNFIKYIPEQNITDIKFFVDSRRRVELVLIEKFGSKKRECPMDLLSDGTLKILGIAAALLSVPEGATVVIEEIDNSIHPTRAHEVLSLMRQYAEERKLKLLLSTHNPALMDALPDEALADVVFCYRDPKEGDSRLVRLGDLDDYLGLVAQGSLGDLVTQGIVERFVKQPTTPEQRKKQALNWLNQLQGAD
ncbi:AAA family ATPase [Psychrobacter sp. PAMC 21119]|uniref:AAA family ATPase n=1 Tax=Psychrobacter sp. PAMC 21119 TaxID=1112209 RepID=UPI000302B222|nr:ATP-binding protein [Psychrobacter sp. PAMC 21119]